MIRSAPTVYVTSFKLAIIYCSRVYKENLFLYLTSSLVLFTYSLILSLACLVCQDLHVNPPCGCSIPAWNNWIDWLIDCSRWNFLSRPPCINKSERSELLNQDHKVKATKLRRYLETCDHALKRSVQLKTCPRRRHLATFSARQLNDR